mmetsp:Transcript_4164/g.6293  ORF Transcript_4164/g.6293 Transcript_4164/m.6293 type:complete len:252 (-) Transcript_4164:747-1502(-)
MISRRFSSALAISPLLSANLVYSSHTFLFLGSLQILSRWNSWECWYFSRASYSKASRFKRASGFSLKVWLRAVSLSLEASSLGITMSSWNWSFFSCMIWSTFEYICSLRKAYSSERSFSLSILPIPSMLEFFLSFSRMISTMLFLRSFLSISAFPERFSSCKNFSLRMSRSSFCLVTVSFLMFSPCSAFNSWYSAAMNLEASFTCLLKLWDASLEHGSLGGALCGGNKFRGEGRGSSTLIGVSGGLILTLR